MLEYDSDQLILDANNNTAPRGWNKIGYTLKTNEQNQLIREFSEQLGFNGTARTWIKSKISTYGLDIEITCKLQIKNTSYQWETKVDGILNLEGIEENEHFLEINVSDSGFNTKLSDRADLEIEYNSKYTINQSEVGGFTNNFVDCSLTGIGGSTTIKGVLPFEAFTKILQKILDVTYPVLKSSILGRNNLTSNGFEEDYAINGYLSLILFTKGLLVSGVEPNGITTKVSGKTDLYLKFNQMFEAFNSIKPIGMGVETIGTTKYIIIEELDYFYQNAQYTTVIEKSAISNISRSLIPMFFNNKIESSSLVASSDNDLGLIDYTGKIEYSTPLNKFKGTYNINNPYSISPADIERARQNPVSGRATDDTFDTDEVIMLIDCYYNGTTLTSRDNAEGFSSFSGLYGSSPLYTNARIRPQMGIFNHSRWIKVGIQNNETEYLVHQKSEKLSKLATQLTGDSIVVTDGNNILMSDLPYNSEQILLTGYKYEFKLDAGYDFLAELQANPRYYLKFWDTTKQDYNYIWVKKYSTNTTDGSDTNIMGYEVLNPESIEGGFIEFMDSSKGNIEFLDSYKGYIEFLG